MARRMDFDSLALVNGLTNSSTVEMLGREALLYASTCKVDWSILNDTGFVVH